MRSLLLFFPLTLLQGQITVDTFAGGKILSGAPAQSVFLQTIAGTAWDPAGNLVFCDVTNNVIRRVRTDGIIETIVGAGVTGFAGDGGPAAAALLNQPKYPRYDGAGNLYFDDYYNFRIRRVDPKGIITTVAGDGIPHLAGEDLTGPALSRPLDNILDLAADRSGNVYFIDGPYNIVRLTPAGNLEPFAGGGTFCGTCTRGDGGPATAAYLSFPTAVAADGFGNVYVLDGGSAPRIRRITPDGIINTFVNLSPPNGNPASAQGLATDASGNVYTNTGSLIRFHPDGTPEAFAAGSGGGSLSIDAAGNIAFVGNLPLSSSSSTAVIREITTQSALKTLAGAAPQTSPDGTPLRDAWFLQPSSLAFDHNGNLYIAESEPCLIRKIDTAGVLSTFAGTGKCGYPSPSGSAKTADLIPPYSIAVDSQNRVWVSDSLLNVYSIAQDGTLSLMFNARQTPVIGGKGALAIDSKDRLTIAGMDSLVRILPDQSAKAIVPAPGSPGFLGIDGLGTDPSGNVYFSSFSDIYRINDDASYTRIAHSGNFTGALALDRAGDIWEGGSGAMTVISPSGIALLGTLRGGFSGDGGLAMNADFSIGPSMAFAPNGDLYFIDGNRIRKLTGSGPTDPPIISQNGIVNAASYTRGGIAPGELLAIFGSNFGPAKSELFTATAQNNTLPTALHRTRVLFNGYPGAITALTATQINVFVPYYALTVGNAVSVAVQVDDVVSQPVAMVLVSAAPGLSTANASGTGQGAIVNQDGSVNSAASPAPAGSVISLYGTGEGLVSPQPSSGALTISTPLPQFANAPQVAIGGQPAQVLYAGEAPLLPAGVFQINARIPSNTPPGNAAVSISIDLAGTTRQVTVAVR